MTEKLTGGAATPPEGKTVHAGCEADNNNFGLPKNKTSGRKKRPAFADLPATTQELMRNIVSVVSVKTREIGRGISDSTIALTLFPPDDYGWELGHADVFQACWWLNDRGYLRGTFFSRTVTETGMSLLDHGMGLR